MKIAHLPPIAALLVLSAVQPLYSAVTLIGTASISGIASDASGQSGHVLTNAGKDSGLPANTFGAAGSAIDYSGADNLYVMATDRGPSNGDARYDNRVHFVHIEIHPNTSTPVTAQVVKTLLLKNSAGRQFIGSSAAFSTVNPADTLRLDPEGVRFSHDPQFPGSFWISDEYGPFLLKFDAAGSEIATIPLPSKYLVAQPDADEQKEISANRTGRLANRGMEGLAITPDHRTLVGVMQSALLQDHVLDAAGKRAGTLTRIIAFNIGGGDGQSHEYVYPLDSAKNGISEILALSDHEFLVLERDGKGGSEASHKRIYRADLSRATDISKPFTINNHTLDYTGTTADNGLPQNGPVAGITLVEKSLYIDLLNPVFALARNSLPEKFEGLAWGPEFDNGDKLLIVTTDNDFLPEQPTRFYAFRITLH